MSGLEDRILTLVKELEEEKRLADKRAKQLYLAVGGVAQTTSKARAYLSSDQNNLPRNTVVKVLLDAKSYDPGNHFDIITNNEYVASVSGYYLIKGQVHWSATDVVNYESYIYVNDIAAKWRSSLKVYQTSQFSLPVSDVLYVAQGENIDLRARHLGRADDADIIGGELITHLTIHLLSI